MTSDALPRAWTAGEVLALGVRTDVPTAGAIIAGWGAAESYKAAKRGDFPVPVISVGRRLVVPVQPILQLLGLALDADASSLITRPERAAALVPDPR